MPRMRFARGAHGEQLLGGTWCDCDWNGIIARIPCVLLCSGSSFTHHCAGHSHDSYQHKMIKL
eukprot:1815298-Amphidinium_carterae.1